MESPPTITFDRVDEIQNFFMNSALGQAWSRIHKIFKFHHLFQKLLVIWEGGGGGGGGRHTNSAFYSVKLCVMINFSLCHNKVLCFSFAVVVYACIAYMQWFYLMKEAVICDKNSGLKRST